MNAVNARELWGKLGSKTQFADWIKSRIEKYDFVDGVDFIVQKILNGESRGFQPIDYFISLDMAKELSMVENNAQGKIARRYFIECEKIVKSKTQKIEPVTKPALSISELNNEFRAAREIVSNRGFINGELNNAAAKLLKEFVGVDLDAIIGVPKKKMDVSKMSQRELVSA